MTAPTKKPEPGQAELLPAVATPMPPAPLPEPTTGQLLSRVIDQGVTSDKIDTLERLIALREREEARQAEKDFAKAFVELQAAMGPVKAMKPVPNDNGSIRYLYAPFEDIMEQVKPLLLKHGFTLTFSSAVDETRITQFCTLQHVSGHKRTNQFAARIGNGPPKSSAAQGDGAASTYAKRFALCDALCIVIEKDSDARIIGAPISHEQAQTLKEMLKEKNADVAKFLQFAGAQSIEEIGAANYDICFRMLNSKKATP